MNVSPTANESDFTLIDLVVRLRRLLSAFDDAVFATGRVALPDSVEKQVQEWRPTAHLAAQRTSEVLDLVEGTEVYKSLRSERLSTHGDL